MGLLITVSLHRLTDGPASSQATNWSAASGPRVNKADERCSENYRMTSLLSDQIKYLAVDLPVSIKLSRITKFFKIENAVIYRIGERMYVYIFLSIFF